MSVEELVRACTVRVLGGPMPGAGFFVAPGVVLTCVHVIEDAEDLHIRWERDDEPAVEVPVTGRLAVLDGRGRPIPSLASDYPDIALLSVEGLTGHPCVAVDLDWPSQDDRFQVYGYPREGGAVRLTSARLAYRGIQGVRPAVFLDLASDTIKPGMSGAAVLSLRPQAVVGVVVASKSTAQPDGALVIPWSAIEADLVETLAANQTFHVDDRRWHSAALSARHRLRFRLPRTAAGFSGRDSLLEHVRSALDESSSPVRTVVLSGLGGVGKTQTAAAFVEAHEAAYGLVAWIRAENGPMQDLAELAVALGLPVAERSPAERAEDALRYLANTTQRWLIVLDNVPGPADLRDLPASGNGDVVVTTRHSGGFAAFGPEIRVTTFDPATAVSYLARLSGRDDPDGAEAVAAALGYLPLALAHAAGYCAQEAGVSFADYVELLEALPSREMFDTNPEAFYEETVEATWNTSIAHATKVTALAREALNMMAFLGADGVPRAYFAQLGDGTALGRKRVGDALAALVRYSLASADEAIISAHRLLLRVVCDNLSDDEAGQAYARGVQALAGARPGDPYSPELWRQWQQLVPHVEALVATDRLAAADAPVYAGLLTDTTGFLVASGVPAEAVELAARSLPQATALLGERHVAVASLRRAKVDALEASGAGAAAVEEAERLVADCERLLPPDAVETLAARGSLVVCYEASRQTARAIAVGEALVQDCEAALGRTHPLTLTAMTDLAASYLSFGRTRDAIRLAEVVAEEREEQLGSTDVATLASLGALAGAYRSAGRVDAAIEIEERVVASREAALGDEHPATLAARYNLASSYRSAGRIDAAIGLEEGVMRAREQVLGPAHPDTLWARGNLALSYQAAGRTSDAIDVATAVLEARERSLGVDHSATLTARANLAISFRSAGRADEAITIQEQLIVDRTRVIGVDHFSTLSARDHLALSYGAAGRLEEAIATGEAVAADRARIIGPDHPATLNSLDNLVATLRAAGRLDESIRLGSEVVADCERVVGPDHPDTIWAKRNLADSYREAGAVDDAIRLGEQALADSERVLGDGHAYSRWARRSLHLSYEAAGRAPLPEDDAGDVSCERILWE